MSLFQSLQNISNGGELVTFFNGLVQSSQKKDQFHKPDNPNDTVLIAQISQKITDINATDKKRQVELASIPGGMYTIDVSDVENFSSDVAGGNVSVVTNISKSSEDSQKIVEFRTVSRGGVYTSVEAPKGSQVSISDDGMSVSIVGSKANANNHSQHPAAVPPKQPQHTAAALQPPKPQQAPQQPSSSAASATAASAKPLSQTFKIPVPKATPVALPKPPVPKPNPVPMPQISAQRHYAIAVPSQPQPSANPVQNYVHAGNGTVLSGNFLGAVYVNGKPHVPSLASAAAYRSSAAQHSSSAAAPSTVIYNNNNNHSSVIYDGNYDAEIYIDNNRVVFHNSNSEANRKSAAAASSANPKPKSAASVSYSHSAASAAQPRYIPDVYVNPRAPTEYERDTQEQAYNASIEQLYKYPNTRRTDGHTLVTNILFDEIVEFTKLRGMMGLIVSNELGVVSGSKEKTKIIGNAAQALLGSNSIYELRQQWEHYKNEFFV